MSMRRTFRKDNTQPVYVISLWATSIKGASKYQAFWARVLELIKDFDPEKLDDNLVLNQFLKQPFIKPGAVFLGITDSTFVGYAPQTGAQINKSVGTKKKFATIKRVGVPNC